MCIIHNYIFHFRVCSRPLVVRSRAPGWKPQTFRWPWARWNNTAPQPSLSQTLTENQHLHYPVLHKGKRGGRKVGRDRKGREGENTTMGL